MVWPWHQDQTEFVKARREPARMSRVRARQEGAQCTTSEIREMRSMTGSLHRATGGTRPDERAVQTIKRLRGQSESGLRFGPLPAKMCVLVFTELTRKWCVLVYKDSALHNADADSDEEGSDDEWLPKAKQKGIRVRSQHDALVCVVNQDDLEQTETIPLSFMTWKSKASKRAVLPTFGAEASACRDALDLAEYTRAMLCEVLIGARDLPDEWTEEHLPIE